MPKPPDPVVFFLDRTLGRKVFASALRNAGVEVEVHDDHFPPDAKDELWLREAAAKGWVVVTNDRRIRYRAIERTVLFESGVRVFAFTSGNLTADEMAELFLHALPLIYRLLRKKKGPFIATITRTGSLGKIIDSR